MTGVSFNDPLIDAGQLSGTVTIDPDGDLANIRACLQLDVSLICVIDGTNILWSGLIVTAPYDDEAQTITITATQVSSWLADRLHGEGTTAVTWKAKDQFQIARELVTYASSGTGCIKIQTGGELSGVTRDLTIDAQSFVPIDEQIANMAKLTKGFDWAVMAKFSAADGLPQLYLGLWYPERKTLGLAPGGFLLTNDPKGGNIQSYDWPNDATARKTKVWATGDGDAPKMMVGSDVDPEVAKGNLLLREKTSSYSGKGLTKVQQLTDNARAERIVLADTVGTLTLTLTDTDPDIRSYGVGDRPRVRIKDPWLDIDLPCARITELAIQDEDRNATAVVTLTIDVSDAKLPVDAES